MKYAVRSLVLVFMTVSLLAVTACGNKTPAELETPKATPARPAATGPSDGNALAAENIFIKIASEVNPAVVNIRSMQRVQGGDSAFGFGEMPKDKIHGFGGDNKKPRSEPAMGSGIIITEDGYILTNAHVVSDATEIKVKLSDKREFDAKLIGQDEKTDVAVLKINTKDKLPKATLGDSSALKTGQWAIAIGNPFGLDHTVTVGVVSGIGRADVGVTQFENFIQTDASINPGNSGGPLLNSRGEVIGINTAIMSPGQGISFAIPINMARDVSKSLIEKGKVVRGWLGVGIQDLTAELADGFRVPVKSGVLVNKVYEGSPAARAHFVAGDVIVEFDGTPVDESHQLQRIVAGTKVGRTVDVKIYREGSARTLKAHIDEMGAFEQKEKSDTARERPERSELLGLSVHPADMSALTGTKGVVVVEVVGDGGADKAGIQVGDVITQIGRIKVEGLADFKKASSTLKKGGTAVLLVVHAKTPRYVAFRLEP